MRGAKASAKLRQKRALRDDIGREIVADLGKAITQVQLALLQSLDLELIEGTELFQRCDRGIKVAMLHLKPVEFRFQSRALLIRNRNPHPPPRLSNDETIEFETNCPVRPTILTQHGTR